MTSRLFILAGEASGDVVGPLVKSLSGNRYGLVVVVRKSRFGLVEPIKDKEAA